MPERKLTTKDIAKIYNVPVESIGESKIQTYRPNFDQAGSVLRMVEREIIAAYFRDVDKETAEIKKEFREYIHKLLFGNPKAKGPQGILKNK